MKRLLLLNLLVLASVASLILIIFFGISFAADGWMLWCKQNGSWFIMAGYPTHDLCNKDLQKKIQFYRNGIGWKVVEVPWNELGEKYESGLVNDRSVGLWCLPSEFHTRDSK